MSTILFIYSSHSYKKIVAPLKSLFCEIIDRFEHNVLAHDRGGEESKPEDATI